MSILNIAVCLLIFCAFSATVSNGEKLSVLYEAKTEATEEEAFQKLLNMETNLKETIESAIKWLMPIAIRQSGELDVSVDCMSSLMKTLFAIRDMKLWAFELLDATGKPGAGLLSGTINQLGSYHQCLNVKIPDNGYGKRPPQTGRYCMVMFSPPLPPKPKTLGFLKPVFRTVNATFKTEVMNELNKYLFGSYLSAAKYGVCIPSGCSNEDFELIVDFAATKLKANIMVDTCEVAEPFHMDFTQKVILAILLSVILVCLVATVTCEYQLHCSDEETKEQKKSYAQRLLESFSIAANFRKLMATKPAEKNSLDSMNGIRYLSMTWVVLGHSYILLNKNYFREPIHALTIRQDIFFSAISGAFMSLESFFLITGVLLAYSLVTTFDQNRSFNPIMAILRRIWRFLPTMAVMTGIMILLPLVGSGPDYKNVIQDLADSCKYRSWWNFLFINNWFKPNEMCLGHFWYLAVDMQCFVLAMVYFFILFKKASYGMIYLGVLVFGCVFSSGLITYIKEFPPGSVLANTDIAFIFEYNQYVYVKPHVHLGIYAVGLFLGTYLARNKKATLSNCYAVMGWIAATCIGITVVYAVHPWNNDVPYTMVEAIMFSATQRTVWGVCLAWVVFACYVGKGSYANELMSWPGFQPLVKISFLIYVTHPIILGYYGFTRLGNQDFTNSQQVWNFFGTLVTSHILSVFFRLFYEAPCIEMERVFCSWLRRGSDETRKKVQEEPQKDDKFTESRRYSVNGQSLGVDNQALKIDL